jgi:GTPase SAR1 family protein
MYASGAEVALLVFDVTSTASYDSLTDWAKLVREGTRDCSCYVVGNKTDLTQQRQITDEQGRSSCDKLRCVAYQATSAVTGEGIADLMQPCSEMPHLGCINALWFV